MGFGPYVAVHDPGELPVSEVKLYKTEMSAGNPVAPPTLFQWDSCFRFTGTRGHASEQIRIFLGVIQLMCFRHDAGRLFLTASKFHELNIFAADVAQMCTFQETSGNSWTRTLVLCIPLKLWPHHPPPQSFIQSHDSYRGQHCETWKSFPGFHGNRNWGFA